MKGIGAMLGKAEMGEPSAAEPDSDQDADLEGAASDLLAAVKADDAAGVARAFKAMMDICNSYGGT